MENYSKMYLNAEPPVGTAAPEVELEETPVIPEPEVTMPEPEPTPEPVISEEPTIGVVVNCTKLNVREQPNAGANIVCVLVALDEVQIDEEESTEEFYKICTVSGLEGFCMKKFIVIREE